METNHNNGLDYIEDEELITIVKMNIEDEIVLGELFTFKEILSSSMYADIKRFFTSEIVITNQLHTKLLDMPNYESLDARCYDLAFVLLTSIKSLESKEAYSIDFTIRLSNKKNNNDCDVLLTAIIRGNKDKDMILVVGLHDEVI